MPEPFRDIDSCSIGWHCLLCGEIVDQVILQNRARPSVPSPMDDDSSEWQYSEDEYELRTLT